MAPIKLYSPPKFYAHSPLPHPNHVQTNLDSLTTQSDPHKPQSSQSYNILNQSFSNPHILISHVFTSILIYIYVSKKCFDKLDCISWALDKQETERLFSSYQLNAHFLYYITIYMLHYNPQHVSSSTLLILRRTNCIITASGIVILCKWPYSMPVDSGLSALNRHTVQLFTESDDTLSVNSRTVCRLTADFPLSTCKLKKVYTMMHGQKNIRRD